MKKSVSAFGRSDPVDYRWYKPGRKVLGRPMADHLRFAVCYWHSFVWPGTDPFGAGTFQRPWHGAGDAMKQARMKADAAFELIRLVRAPFFAFHDYDIAPEGTTLRESNLNVRRMGEVLKRSQMRLPYKPRGEALRTPGIYCGTIAACGLISGICKASPHMRQSLLNFAQDVGLAYQIADDLLVLLGQLEDELLLAQRRDAAEEQHQQRVAEHPAESPVVPPRQRRESTLGGAGEPAELLFVHRTQEAPGHRRRHGERDDGRQRHCNCE